MTQFDLEQQIMSWSIVSDSFVVKKAPSSKYANLAQLVRARNS